MKYEPEIAALLEKAERSLKASKSLICSEDYDFSISSPDQEDGGRVRTTV
jgi:uncharacterized protein (UPF0332 family)